MGDTIVVMGGICLSTLSSQPNVNLKTAEWLVLGENSWKKLPAMHHERVGASACVQP
jgi:hypothetical protein